MHTAIVAIINHKGGTGKTTTSINLGCALARMGKKILLIDLDPQGSLTYSMALNPAATVAEVLSGELDWDEMLELKEGMHLAASSPALANIEISLANYPKREFVLKESLRNLSRYDYILIDCAPSFSLLTVNALCAASHILIPMQLEVLSLQGFYMMMDTVTQIKKRLNTTLEVLGVILVMVDIHKKVGQEIYQMLSEQVGDLLFKAHIELDEKAIEAPSFGKSILEYAPHTISSEEYKRLAQEFLQRIQK